MIYGRLLYSSYILGTGANQQRTIERYILTRMTWTGDTILRQHRPTNVCPVLQIPRPKMFRTMYCRIIVANSKLFRDYLLLESHAVRSRSQLFGRCCAFSSLSLIWSLQPIITNSIDLIAQSIICKSKGLMQGRSQREDGVFAF